jgi:hypothetical protein
MQHLDSQLVEVNSDNVMIDQINKDFKKIQSEIQELKELVESTQELCSSHSELLNIVEAHAETCNNNIDTTNIIYKCEAQKKHKFAKILSATLVGSGVGIVGSQKKLNFNYLKLSLVRIMFSCQSQQKKNQQQVQIKKELLSQNSLIYIGQMH